MDRGRVLSQDGSMATHGIRLTDRYLAWDNAVGDLPIAGDWNADGRSETGSVSTGAGFYLKMDHGNTGIR